MRGLRGTIVTLTVTLVIGTATPALARVPVSVSVGATVLASVEVSGLDAADADHIRALWGEFVASVPAHAACLLAAPPRIVKKTDMRPRAAYAPASATLYVRPGDMSRLVVFHELAHHLDFTCGGAETIGDEVRRHQGIDPSIPWWLHGDPASWPAEYFANAVAEALGETTRHDVRPETVEAVSRWLGLSELPPPRTPLILDEPNSSQPSII